MDYKKYCAITYNEKLIDKLLPEYTTINVEGRGLAAPIFETIDIDGRDGDYILSQKERPRNIKVYFIIKSSSNEKRLGVIDKLNLMLKTKEDVKVSFGDQLGYWVGRLSDVQDIAYDYYTGKGQYIIHCQNPYRHMPLIKLQGNSIEIKTDLYIKLELEKLKATVTNTKEVRIVNSRTGDIISLKNLPNLGELIIDKKKIKLNGQNVIKCLDESISTWKGFSIESGDKLSIYGATNMSLNIRRYL